MYVTTEDMVSAAADMGIDSPEEFVSHIHAVNGLHIPLQTFIMYCIQYTVKEQKKLKEEIECMKQERNS